jgi:hypothetical protein
MRDDVGQGASRNPGRYAGGLPKIVSRRLPEIDRIGIRGSAISLNSVLCGRCLFDFDSQARRERFRRGRPAPGEVRIKLHLE